MKHFQYTIVLSIVCMSLFSSISMATPPDPAQPGPYPVGVTTLQFSDPARTEVLTGKARALLTEIWYPAAEETRELPKNRLLDFILRGTNPSVGLLLKLAFDIDLEEMDKSFQNFAVRDARIRDGKYPLILFSHGNGGLRFQNAFLCEHLASHGYIVAAPDHTGNAAVTFVDGQPIRFNEQGRDQAAKDRPLDIRFLIDEFTRLNQGADSRFLERIDLDNIGVTGHSFGGYTSTWAADTDLRVKAIAPMAGVARERVNYDCPVLVLMATEDKTMGLDGNANIRRYYEESKGPRYFVEFKNAGHFSFTEMYQFKADFGDGVGAGKRIASGEDVVYPAMEFMFPVINTYSTAFFGKYLKTITEYDGYLRENKYPEELIVK
jgi:predicted dienelactone hydrolase